MLGIGEGVIFKFPAKGPQSDPAGNMEQQWGEGVFLGYDRGSNTFLVGNADSINEARTITRKPLDQR